DFHLLPHGPLAHVIGEAQGPDGAVETLLAVAGGGGNQAVVLDHGRFSGALSAPGSFGYRAFQRLANQGFTGGALARLPGGGADHFGRVLGFVTEGNEGALRLRENITGGAGRPRPGSGGAFTGPGVEAILHLHNEA